jgi:hypothetical protein
MRAGRLLCGVSHFGIAGRDHPIQRAARKTTEPLGFLDRDGDRIIIRRLATQDVHQAFVLDQSAVTDDNRPQYAVAFRLGNYGKGLHLYLVQKIDTMCRGMAGGCDDLMGLVRLERPGKAGN